MPSHHRRGELRRSIPLLLLIPLLAAACTPARSAPAPTPAASPVAQADASAPPPPSDVVGGPPADPTEPGLQMSLQPGSIARYRAHEMVLGRSYFSDAIGSTDQISGDIYFTADGKLVPDGSLITVNLRNLKSDEPQRDAFIQANTLETADFPEATFAVTKVEGLPDRVGPDTGSLSFRLTGDLTIHGVTKPAIWVAAGEIVGDQFTGTASTTITFEDFGMTPPKVPVILGVDDSVRLELAITARQIKL